MAACTIQVGNPEVLKKIESFLNDPSYREVIENSSNYNSRLCIERRMRMPFLDSQTGVAQNHSNLFMSPRQRIPGLITGQIYTYPSKRWRKKRRQYLMNFLQPRRKEMEGEVDLHTISTIENPAAIEDIKESVVMGMGMGLKDETPKVPEAWYFDELDMQEMEGFDDPDPDSDYDYEESYSKRKKKRPSKVARNADSPAVKKPKGPGRGRKKASYDTLTDADKPFACELCGARYKTRPGLTYHYTHSHKEREGDEESPGVSDGASSPGTKMLGASPQQQPQATELATPGAAPAGGSSRRGGGRQSGAMPPHVLTPMIPVPSQLPDEPHILQPMVNVEKLSIPEVLPPPQVLTLTEEKERAAPSPYCDFCLGDSNENKKTNQSEELVSCSDCGRSGHPTCLQFTDNMIISVRKYRWQCIECKCCSICGNSDNDDQLLFCDDCDRGYHMYCLAPPLTTPPEGSWSCRLCLDEFHHKQKLLYLYDDDDDDYDAGCSY